MSDVCHPWYLEPTTSTTPGPERSVNPLIDDRLVRFLLDAVHPAEPLCALPAFSDHDAETFSLYIDACRRLAQDQLYPAYRAMDLAPPELADGRVTVHPVMQELWPRMVELGLIVAARPPEVGGANLPQLVATMAHLPLMAANAAAVGYPLLTAGAAHLIEVFGDEAVKGMFLAPMYEGRWAGTMALTEPQAGSSLGDLTTSATPAADGTYRISGSKIFISGGDQDLTENVVHLTLARIEGAPAGTRGVSLFAVPRRRPTARGELVDNDVETTQLIHKIGWRGLPSLGLNYGEAGECRGWLVGEAGRGLNCMFQMMNEARVMVGAQGAATASVAYHEALEFRRLHPLYLGGQRDPSAAQRPILQHADVRRMLLRQRAIVGGSITLVAAAARYADLAAHGPDEATRERADRLLTILTPVVKTFPAEYGYEANTLALQIFGGYGYSSEYLPESWLRDQKLNSIHEGTTGIQGLDLLGRKVMADSGASLRALADEIISDVRAAKKAGVEPAAGEALSTAVQALGGLTMELGSRGMRGDVDAMLRHSHDYLTLFSVVIVAWQWLKVVTAAQGHSTEFHAGLRCAADYWFSNELTRVPHLVELCRAGEDSYVRIPDGGF